MENEALNFNWFWYLLEGVSLTVLVYYQLRVCRIIRDKNDLLDSFLPDKNYVSISRRTENEYSTKLISLLYVNDSANSLLKEICRSINDYLKKNKGNAADFHLLKNILVKPIFGIPDGGFFHTVYLLFYSV